MYLYIDTFHRYLGLFGDHIVSAVLYCYRQLVVLYRYRQRGWQASLGRPDNRRDFREAGFCLQSVRHVTAARVMVLEMKCELDLYEYVLVHT